jgi:hypothetical protein
VRTVGSVKRRKKPPPRAAVAARLAAAPLELEPDPPPLLELRPGQLALPGLDLGPLAEKISDECYTPQHLLDVAELLLGSPIDTDPAWHPGSLVRPRVHGYTIDDDGLDERNPWIGSTWINPPYSNTGPFVDRLAWELEDQIGMRAVLLVKLDPTTAWWRKLRTLASSMCLVGERVKHLGDFARGKTPIFCSALFTCRGPSLERCRQVYSGGEWFPGLAA